MDSCSTPVSLRLGLGLPGDCSLVNQQLHDVRARDLTDTPPATAATDADAE